MATTPYGVGNCYGKKKIDVADVATRASGSEEISSASIDLTKFTDALEKPTFPQSKSPSGATGTATTKVTDMHRNVIGIPLESLVPFRNHLNQAISFLRLEEQIGGSGESGGAGACTADAGADARRRNIDFSERQDKPGAITIDSEDMLLQPPDAERTLPPPD